MFYKRLSHLAHFRLNTCFGVYANSADPVQLPQNVASDQGLYCLLPEICIENTVRMETAPETPNHHVCVCTY